MHLRVFGTPADFSGSSHAAVIVIDALRMTSVAVTAIANGCMGLMAVSSPKEAQALAAQSGALLGGEVNALKIPVFDLDNSPLAYAKQQVQGRKIVMSTTNGTRAICKAQGAGRVLLGAFVNASAAARAVHGEAEVCILCAGTEGAFTLEDALAAGAIATRLHAWLPPLSMDDMALACLRLYQGSRENLAAALADTRHYARLLSLNLQADLDYCLQEDQFETVPQQQANGWFA